MKIHNLLSQQYARGRAARAAHVEITHYTRYKELVWRPAYAGLRRLTLERLTLNDCPASYRAIVAIYETECLSSRCINVHLNVHLQWIGCDE